MKRFVAVCTIILLLSFPALGDHKIPGFGWCDCNDPASHYQCLVLEDENIHDHETPEIVTVLNAFAFWLSIRA